MENKDNKDDFKGLFRDRKSRNFTSWVVGITISLLAIFLLINQLLCIKDFGQLGDFFNGIAAPVLSLITIILLYHSFLIQKEELKATRIALEQSTKEMQNSAAIMERTEQNAKLERLENIAFKLLEKYEISRDKFVLNDYYQGINAIKELYDNIKNYNPKIKLLRASINSEKQKDNNYKQIQEILRECIIYLKNDTSSNDTYDYLKSLVHKFLSIYKCFYEEKMSSEKLSYLRTSINVQISGEEWFFILLLTYYEEDLNHYIDFLKVLDFRLEPQEIFDDYIKKGLFDN